MKLLLRQQQTIAKPVTVEGFGFWSGLDVRVEFRPAPPDSGVTFFRDDLDRSPPIPATATNRVEIPRRTNLSANGVSVEMVEHLLAALAGLQIDNCEVGINRAEVPGCDGSSLPFVEALLTVEHVQQSAIRQTLVISRITRVGDDQCWIEARPNPAAGLNVRYCLDYGLDGPIRKQTLELSMTPRTFRDELAAARTFILQHEAEWMLAQGLGQRVTCDDLLVFDQQGPIGNQLRFPDECVRHKTLDLIGDLSLANCDVHGRITAYRSGHRLNVELVKSLLQNEPLIGQDLRVA